MAAGSVNIPPGTYGPGTTQTPARAVSGTLSQATFTFDQTNFTDPAVSVSVSVEISLDSGATWQLFGAAKWFGGSRSAPITMTISSPPASNRQIRATIVIAGGSLQTSGTLSWS